MNPKNVYVCKRLCHQHFEAKYVSSWSHKLFANAVPTLNLPGISSQMILCDTPSTSTKSIEVISSKCDKSSSSSTQPYEPDIVIEIPEQSNSSNRIEGNAGSAPLTPYQLLKQTGIAKHAITPKKKEMYEAMKQLRKKYTMEINKKKSFRRRLSEAEQFRDTHHLEENIAKLNNMASMLIQCQLRMLKRLLNCCISLTVYLIRQDGSTNAISVCNIEDCAKLAESDEQTFSLAVVFFLIRYLIADIRRPSNFPPGPFPLPIVGNLPELKKLSIALGGQHLALSKLSEIYKSNVIGLKLGSKHIIAVFSYELVKTVLTSEEYEGRPDDFFTRLRTMGVRKGIVGTDGDLWRIQRSFIAVHLHKLGFSKESMEIEIQKEVTELLNILGKSGNEEMQIKYILPISVLNILWAFVSASKLPFDIRLAKLLEILDRRGKAFDMSGGTLNILPWLRYIAPEKTGYNLIVRLNNELQAMLMEPIEEHFETWTEGRNDDLMYSFITEMNKDQGDDTTFTKEQLLMVCLDLFIAGSQTTSNTLEFAFLMMILHPDITDRVHICLDAAFDKSEEITYSKRNRVPYVEAVLCEVQRYRHVVPISGPRRVLRNTTLGGYNIPKDSTVLISLYSVHNDKDYWKDPEVFRPERFLNDEGRLIYHERYLPLGFGKRRCLGEILAKNCLFSFFSEIMRSYDIELPDGAEQPTGIPHPGISLVPESYRAVFKKRLNG
ncbi:hypothetical protein JTB14_008367 [Gonioctena quinquepunctata]|nr:hypothetical protein JTB14_008367 [Gonioctena quinquepunctata]